MTASPQPLLLPQAGGGPRVSEGRMRGFAVATKLDRSRMIVRRPPKQLGRARAMRSEPTTAEDIVWRSLRSAALGVKFRRQVPIGSFIADFACLPLKLVVELDGPPHETTERKTRDNVRDRWFAEHGWRVLRIPNEVVFGGGEMAIERIQHTLHSGPSSDPASPGHLLPQAGEGEVDR